MQRRAALRIHNPGVGTSTAAPPQEQGTSYGFTGTSKAGVLAATIWVLKRSKQVEAAF